MKATELIETHHRAVEELFEQILAEDCSVTRLVDDLARKLLAHMLMEEVVLFPELMRLDEGFVREAIEEHTVARFELRRVLKASVLEPDFTAKVTTLRGLIEHHVREEERELLPKIDASLSREANEQLGRHMEELFKTLVLRSNRTGRDPSATHDFFF
jgi:iron-sulfur cluster repair protein YtfE (RIC family)